MLATMRFVALAAVLAFLTVSSVDAKAERGLAWGTDNRWAKKIARGSISWYHHWQMAEVPQMPNGVEFVPMDWGPKYNNLWQQRKKWIAKNKPSHVLSINEPDVKGQANMSPAAAAARHMREMEPLRRRGIQVSSPQIVWNTKWMRSFLNRIHKQGGDVDFIAVHYYGSWKDLGRFQKFIKNVRKQFNKDIWVTEYGVTASSGGSSSQIERFQSKAAAWMDRRHYVKRIAWLGCFALDNPPDSFASARNAMFSSGGNLRSIAYSFVYGKRALEERSASDSHIEARSTPGMKRHHMQHHRRVMTSIEQSADLARRNGTVDAQIHGVKVSTEEYEEYLKSIAEQESDVADESVVDCDEICQLRDELTKDEVLDDDDNMDDD